MHIDIDAFFASAEISRNKELENKPVGVAVKLSGILSAANYIARQYGVKAAMHINKAKELCPELICIKADMNFYRELSNNFFSFLDFYLKKNIEIASVDECYVDITDILEQFNNNENLFVANLKYQIKKEFGLNVSIGISKNKYTAKLLSDNSKPNGFLSDNKVEVQDFKIDNMLYIGTDKIKKLNDNDIFTIRDFFDPINEHKIRNIISNIYDKIKYSFFSSDVIILENLNRPNALSKGYDFTENESNVEIIESILISLLNDLTFRINRLDFEYQTISIYYRIDKKISRISAQIDYTKSWLENLLDLFNSKWKNFNVNYIGVTLSSVIDKQEILFNI